MSTHSLGNVSISSSATVEITGQNIDNKQQEDREAFQFTIISSWIKAKNKNVRQQNPYSLKLN